MEIPGYEIERELGRGGFSIVYLARQPKLHRTVAVKVLTAIDPADEDAKARFEAECHAIGSLSWHPHVVTVHDTGVTADGRPFLAMEHLPAGSLQAKLAAHGPAPWTEVVKAGVQVADALAGAHAAGILHRDVKPANVLTDRVGDYQLADFGIARFGDTSRTAAGVLTGTVTFTAPEQLRGERASPASDLYGLGATLYAIAAGRAPYTTGGEDSVAAILYRIATEPSPPLQPLGLPPDLARLIAALMAREPADRPASAVEVGQWLQQIQRDHGLAVTTLRSAPSAGPAVPARYAGHLVGLTGATLAAPMPAVGTVATSPPGAQPQFASASALGGAAPPAPAAAPPGRFGGRGALVAVGALAVLLLAGAGVLVALRLGDGDREAGPRTTTTRAITTSTPTTDARTTETPTTAAGYSPEARRDFVEGCARNGQPTEICGCIYDRIAATVPFEDFEDFARNPDPTNLPAPIQAAIIDCAAAGGD